ncbi:hypothetical protein JKP88DRAFT_247788 [Tribonema minus]|uniref:Uncharacterized protein n=1 Tax=Tribonema minus TaxID=303371 RepID=A0A836CBH6_9STRA|nr:hypothetical protein JKP88DRAFT_247788 [Tribonema minus]
MPYIPLAALSSLLVASMFASLTAARRIASAALLIPGHEPARGLSTVLRSSSGRQKIVKLDVTDLIDIPLSSLPEQLECLKVVQQKPVAGAASMLQLKSVEFLDIEDSSRSAAGSWVKGFLAGRHKFGVRKLIMRDVQPVHVPSCLRFLELAEVQQYNRPQALGYIRGITGLESLHLSTRGNLRSLRYPPRLRHLVIVCAQFEDVSLPASLQSATIKCIQPFNENLARLPPALVTLNLQAATGFNRSLGNLPATLETLRLGSAFSQPLGALPAGLKVLQLPVAYPHKLALPQAQREEGLSSFEPQHSLPAELYLKLYEANATMPDIEIVLVVMAQARLLTKSAWSLCWKLHLRLQPMVRYNLDSVSQQHYEAAALNRRIIELDVTDLIGIGLPHFPEHLECLRVSQRAGVWSPASLLQLKTGAQVHTLRLRSNKWHKCKELRFPKGVTKFEGVLDPYARRRLRWAPSTDPRGNVCVPSGVHELVLHDLQPMRIPACLRHLTIHEDCLYAMPLPLEYLMDITELESVCLSVKSDVRGLRCPPHLRHITITRNLLADVSLPASLESLTLTSPQPFNENLAPLPPALVTLQLQAWFNQSLGPLPGSLQTSQLCAGFSQPLGALPAGLESLHLPHDYPHALALPQGACLEYVNG